MKKIFSKIAVIMVLMLSTISSGCSSNKNSFEEWAKGISSEFTGTRYTINLEHEDEAKYDFYTLWGDEITKLYDYELSEVKKWKYASGINYFYINEEFFYSGDSKLLGKSGLIIEDFENKFVSKKIGDMKHEDKDYLAVLKGYKGTSFGHLCILKDGRKCHYCAGVTDNYEENKKDRVYLVFHIFE